MNQKNVFVSIFVRYSFEGNDIVAKVEPEPGKWSQSLKKLVLFGWKILQHVYGHYS